jgi:hypothetical protein
MKIHKAKCISVKFKIFESHCNIGLDLGIEGGKLFLVCRKLKVNLETPMPMGLFVD